MVSSETIWPPYQDLIHPWLRDHLLVFLRLEPNNHNQKYIFFIV